MLSGFASGTQVNFGGQFLMSGSASFTTIEGGVSNCWVPAARKAIPQYIAAQNWMFIPAQQRKAVVTNTTILSGGTEAMSFGAVTNNTTIAGGNLDLGTGFGALSEGSASGDIIFTSPGGGLFVETTDLPSVPILGFGRGDTIDITDLTYSAGDHVTVGTPGFVTITAGESSYDFNIVGATSSTPYELVVGTTDSGLVLLDPANAPCFAAGTRILTARGEVSVEKLAFEDTVITKDGKDAPIVWIGHRRIDLTRHPRPEQARPIHIAADALDEGVPRRDLLLSPDHALFIDGALIPAKALLNDRNIMQLTPKTITYFHIELAEHSVIFAETARWKPTSKPATAAPSQTRPAR